MRNSSVSQRLHHELDKLISNTEPGERLPSEPHLAQELGVSRATLREAMRTFETRGVIRRKQGSGTYVSYPPHVIDSGLEVLESMISLAERNDIPASITDLQIERRVATKGECKSLDLDECEEIISITRVMVAKDRPAAYLIDVLPVDVLKPEELKDTFKGSVLDYLLERGEPRLVVSKTEINAVTASPEVARALGIQRRDVLLCLVADLYTSDGRVVDHSWSYFLPGYFRFHVVRRVG